jgi:hypothetical protein
VAGARGDGAGGIRGLVGLIEEHGEAIDFDLRQFCHVRLGDVVAGRVTLREFGSLLRHMPADGTAQWRHARRNPAPGRKGVEPPDDWWTPERDLLAGIADGISVLIWLQTKDAREGRNHPKPIPRPGVRKDAPPKRLDPEAAMARLAAIGPSGGGRVRDGREGEADHHGEPDEAQHADDDAGYGESVAASFSGLGLLPGDAGQDDPGE